MKRETVGNQFSEKKRIRSGEGGGYSGVEGGESEAVARAEA